MNLPVQGVDHAVQPAGAVVKEPEHVAVAVGHLLDLARHRRTVERMKTQHLAVGHHQRVAPALVLLQLLEEPVQHPHHLGAATPTTPARQRHRRRQIDILPVAPVAERQAVAARQEAKVVRKVPAVALGRLRTRSRPVGSRPDKVHAHPGNPQIDRLLVFLP